jgi:cysteine desulfurase / selenocysteine lyase
MDDADVALARRHTPGCEHVVHFNNAGSALPPRVVLDTVVEHLASEAAMGGYEAEAAAQPRIDAVYASIARLLNCAADEIALVENATRGWDMAFYAMKFAAGDRILTARAEYASNFIAFLQVARRSGAVIDVVPSESDGSLSVEALERMIDGRVKLIAVTHVPTNGGLVNPAAEIGRVARAHGVPYLLDACQSVGQMPIDVEAIGCDMLSVTGRKYLRGPRGTGFLYVRRSMLDALEPPLLDLHAATWVAPDRYEIRPDARRFENWESYIAGRLGLGAAVDYALGWGLPAIRDRVVHLAEDLRDGLQRIRGVQVQDLGGARCGIVTFTKNGIAPNAIRQILAEQHINVTVSRASSTRLDMDARGLDAVVRASVHYYNDAGDAERFLSAVRAL